MKVPINKTKKKIKGHFIIMMEKNLKEKQKMTKKEEKVPTNIKKDIQILKSLKRIYFLEKENIFVMAINIKEILKKIKKKEMELTFIMMEKNMKRILRMIKLTVREFM